MRVIVVGAGEVGSSIAASLAEAHDVVVVDLDGDRVDSLTYELDVLAIEGDGTSLSTLQEAGIDDADMVIASTDNDEANIVTCSTTKTVSDAFTIARVKKVDLLTTWEHSEGAFGVDFMVCVNLLTAQAIVRLAGTPGAQDVETFSNGVVQMAQFEVSSDSPVADQTVAQADRFDSLTFAAVLRDDDVVIPRGDTRIAAGDSLVVIGSPSSIRGFAESVTPKSEPDSVDEIVIVGGGEIGYQTARLLADRGVNPRLVERDPERAREIAEELPDVMVMESDATDVEFLAREHVDEADLVVSTLESDEKNLLVSLLAKRVGAARTVAIVEHGDYVGLFETVGVDVAVNPREVTAEEITRFTRERKTENVAVIESDRAEVLEIEVDSASFLVGTPIREVAKDLPPGVVIGAITRNDRLVTPRGDTVIQNGDHVVLFVEAEILDDVVGKL